jgi:hypothetical protein
MKKSILVLAALALFGADSIAQEWKVVTIVESIVPSGLGRSRIVENTGEVDVEALTTEREGNKSKQGSVSRKDVKESGENLRETKLVNFYSMVGINFGNIAANDAVITAKINELSKQGWKLTFVTSGVESDAGKEDGNGIFITRLFFSK